MSGTVIIREMLAAYAPLLALVPDACIIAGKIPQGTPLPAISISEVDSYEEETVARLQATTTRHARIRATVVSQSLASQEAVIRKSSLGPGTHRGTVLTFKVLSVLPGGVGPALNNLDDDGIYEQARDFVVTFVEPN